MSPYLLRKFLKFLIYEIENEIDNLELEQRDLDIDDDREANRYDELNDELGDLYRDLEKIKRCRSLDQIKQYYNINYKLQDFIKTIKIEDKNLSSEDFTFIGNRLF